MFTGIIQGQGEIVGLRRSGQECRMEVRPLFPLENIVDGESIAHNGACLSVERHSGSTFTVYASGESLSRTTLGDLRKGDLVNLERALALGDRLKALQGDYDRALNQLSEGNGSLVRQADRLKKMGLTPKKQLSDRLQHSDEG